MAGSPVQHTTTAHRHAAAPDSTARVALTIPRDNAERRADDRCSRDKGKPGWIKSHHSLGAVGILTGGGLRDVREVGALGGFHCFCAGLAVSHGNPICVSVGDKVTTSRMRVRPGDLPHGDVNGVVPIPEACAAGVAAAAHATWAREGETMRRVTSPAFLAGRGAELKH